LVWLARLD